MKGNNSITMNNITMQEALQEYLNKRSVGGADKVTYVSANPDNTKFTISLEEVKVKP